MNICHTLKYYYSSKSGVKSIVKNIVKDISFLRHKCEFTIFSNNYSSNSNRTINSLQQLKVFKGGHQEKYYMFTK